MKEIKSSQMNEISQDLEAWGEIFIKGKNFDMSAWFDESQAGYVTDDNLLFQSAERAVNYMIREVGEYIAHAETETDL